MPPCSLEEDRHFFWVTAKRLCLPEREGGWNIGSFEEAAAGLKTADLLSLPATL